MTRNRSSRQKLNNKGISLVELLVAIAIMAIIITPLLYGFVVSVKTNVKAREKLKANAVAQDLLEGMGAISVEDIVYQFNYPAADVSKNYKGFTITKINGNKTNELLYKQDPTTGDFYYSQAKNLNNIGAEVLNPEALMDCSLNVDGTLKPNAEGKYYLWAEDIDGYNALVTVDAHEADAANPIYDTYNNSNKAVLNVVDADKDAVCTNFKTEAEVVQLLKEHGYKKDSTHDLTASDITRRIFVDMSKDASTNAIKVVVTYRYYFKTTQQGNVVFPAAGSAEESNFRFVVFDNYMDTTKELGSVFLLFEPWYQSTGASVLSTPIEGSSYKDGIIVNNPNDLTNKLYLVKQKYSATDLLETTYKMDVDVRESNYNSTAAIQIRTNLNENIAGISNAANQTQYKYGGHESNLAANVSGLSEMEVKDSLYEVKVYVYKKSVSVANLTDSATSPIVTLSGGLLD